VNHMVPVEMKFIGKINEHPLFQLNISGTPEQNDFIITVRDEFEEVLYKENFKGDYFSKKFLLNTDELGDATLLFEISCKKTRRSVIYQINRGTRLVQDVAIREMK